MQYVPGPTIQQSLDDGHGFTDGDTMKICEVYLTLRAIWPKGDELFPTGPWLLKGHIFQPDGEGGLKMKSRSAFQSYMSDRLTRAVRKSTTLPESEVVLNHGDLSPPSLKLMPDGRVGFLNVLNVLWGPVYWDRLALFASSYPFAFTRPMEKAMDKRGIRINPGTHQKLWTLMIWHGTKGAAVAR